MSRATLTVPHQWLPSVTCSNLRQTPSRPIKRPDLSLFQQQKTQRVARGNELSPKDSALSARIKKHTTLTSSEDFYFKLSLVLKINRCDICKYLGNQVSCTSPAMFSTLQYQGLCNPLNPLKWQYFTTKQGEECKWHFSFYGNCSSRKHWGFLLQRTLSSAAGCNFSFKISSASPEGKNDHC